MSVRIGDYVNIIKSSNKDNKYLIGECGLIIEHIKETNYYNVRIDDWCYIEAWFKGDELEAI